MSTPELLNMVAKQQLKQNALQMHIFCAYDEASNEAIKVWVDKHSSQMKVRVDKAKVYENKVPSDFENDLIK